MNRLCGILLLIILMSSQGACKKESGSHIPSALIGKWYLRQTNVTASSKVIGYYYHSDTRFGDTSIYYCQFNRDGAGVQKIYTSGIPYNISPTNFTYSVADTNITFSSNWALQAKACSYEMPGNDTLTIRGYVNYTDHGMTTNSLQELKLTK